MGSVEERVQQTIKVATLGKGYLWWAGDFPMAVIPYDDRFIRVYKVKRGWRVADPHYGRLPRRTYDFDTARDALNAVRHGRV